MGMTQMEKVLNGIEEVRNSGIQCPLENVEPRRCFHFPDKLIDSIVSLLKAQEALLLTLDEARVMTMDEVFDASKNMDAGAVFIEYVDYDYGGITFVDPALITNNRLATETMYRIEAVFHHGNRRRFKPEEYNSKWRVWTANPTEDQREAAEWE